MNDYTYSILRILAAKNIGNKKAFNLIQELNSKGIDLVTFINDIDKNIYNSVFSEDICIKLKETNYKVDLYREKLSQNKINSVNRFESHYPPKLLTVLKDNAPLMLFYKGNYDLIKKKSIGFCGSRDATDTGLATVEMIIQELQDKVVYISGYAKGIDIQVHKLTLEKKYNTIVVLPEGILNFRVKKELKDSFNYENALVISEFLPDSNWSVGNAMQRNLTIISLSKAMILIEAKEKGGSFNAGQKTLDLGIPLYAPIYKDNSEKTKGNEILRAKGAKGLMKGQITQKPKLQELYKDLDLNNENLEDNPISISQLNLF